MEEETDVGYEENEERRIDLLERELSLREKAFDREVDVRERELAAREATNFENKAYRVDVIANLNRHESLLERMAAALERIAENGHR
jgi:hypothetical protein